jgi:MFS family permease
VRPVIATPLRYQPFRLLFAGQVVSDLGDWLDFLALIAIIVYRWDLGPAALAALSVAVALPRVVLGPVAGVLADRMSRKSIMIICDLARAVVVFGLVWAPDLPTVLALVALKGVFSTFFSPARQATIPSTLPEDHLLAANSLSQTSSQMSKVLGPVIGGFLVAAAGPRAAFAIDAMTFVLSAVFLSLLPAMAARSSSEGEEEEEGSFWSDFREGIVYLVHRRTLTVAIGSMSAALFMMFIIDSMGVLALRAVGVDEALFGVAVGSIGLGTIAGAIAVAQWGNRVHPFGIMGAGQLVFGLGVGVLGLAVLAQVQTTGLSWMLLYGIIGLAAAGVMVPYGFVVQRETPRELMGRVFATADGIETGFQLIAPPLGAVMVELWGVGPVLAGAGVALALVGIAVSTLRPSIGLAFPREQPDLEGGLA